AWSGAKPIDVSVADCTVGGIIGNLGGAVVAGCVVPLETRSHVRNHPDLVLVTGEHCPTGWMDPLADHKAGIVLARVALIESLSGFGYPVLAHEGRSRQRGHVGNRRCQLAKQVCIRNGRAYPPNQCPVT